MSAWTPDEIALREVLEQGDVAVAVNVRKRGPHARLVPWAQERGLLVYVGHAVRFTPWPKSVWANPFRPANRESVSSSEAREILAAYRSYVTYEPALNGWFATLAGKALGCWCVPGPCHAAELAAMVNERSESHA